MNLKYRTALFQVLMSYKYREFDKLLSIHSILIEQQQRGPSAVEIH